MPPISFKNFTREEKKNYYSAFTIKISEEEELGIPTSEGFANHLKHKI